MTLLSSEPHAAGPAHASAELSVELGTYGGEQAVACDECGAVSPSAEALFVHLLRRCCGRLGRGA